MPTQTLASKGPWTQTQSSAAALVRMSPWSQVAEKATPDPHGPSSNVVPGYQPRWRPKVLESAWPSMATGATDINPGCSKATNPDMAPNCSPGPEAIVAPSSSMCHSYLYDPCCIMDLGHQHDP